MKSKINLFVACMLFIGGALMLQSTSVNAMQNHCEKTCSPGKESTGKGTFSASWEICCDESTTCDCCFSDDNDCGEGVGGPL